jgi:hypothetical protein
MRRVAMGTTAAGGLLGRPTRVDRRVGSRFSARSLDETSGPTLSATAEGAGRY